MLKKHTPGCRSGRCSCCPSHVCAYVRSCGGVPVSGATITVTGPGGFTAGGTTDSSGRWCAEAGGTGAYSVTASDGSITETKTVTVGSACASYYASFCLGGLGLASIAVAGCRLGSPMAGVSVTATQGAFSTSFTTTAGYTAVCFPATDPVTITASRARWTTKVVVSPRLRNCGGTTFVVVQLDTPAAGYHCCPCFGCDDPLDDTLYLSDSRLGISATLAYDSATSAWIGEAAYSYPGCFGPYGEVLCPAADTTVKFTFCKGHPYGFNGYRYDHYVEWKVYSPALHEFDPPGGFEPGTFGCCPGGDVWGCVVRMVDTHDPIFFSSGASDPDYPSPPDSVVACPPTALWFYPLAEDYNPQGVSIYGGDGHKHFGVYPGCMGHSTTWTITEP